jgi:DNA-binding NarL/FixJ family response regulator
MAPRILIVDDQEMILRALRTLFESSSRFAICGAALNGSEAVIKARELHPDVIILDLAMPVMNGLQAAQEIGRSQPDIPILLYTMSDLPEVRLEAARAGIREVVGKSAGSQLLLDAVDRALRKPVAAELSRGETEIPLAITSSDANGMDGAADSQHPAADAMDQKAS